MVISNYAISEACLSNKALENIAKSAIAPHKTRRIAREQLTRDHVPIHRADVKTAYGDDVRNFITA